MDGEKKMPTPHWEFPSLCKRGTSPKSCGVVLPRRRCRVEAWATYAGFLVDLLGTSAFWDSMHFDDFENEKLK